MSRDVMTNTPELSVWTKDLSAALASSNAILERVKKLDIDLQDTRAGLENEASSRLLWQKRAKDYESRIAQSQYVLLLIDGNQTCFKDHFIRHGSENTEQLVKQLISEVRTIALQQHKNDLQEISVLINIFVDTNRLTQDLMAAGSISKQHKLQVFFHALTECHPLVSVIDCGNSGAVEAKMKALYELNIENCHCRHTILALGHHSDYYEILESYSEDEYTVSKTSLVTPDDGFPSTYSSSFHSVKFSVLHSVRLIDLSERASTVYEEDEPTCARELRSLHILPSEKGRSESVVKSAQPQLSVTSGTNSSHHSASKGSSQPIESLSRSSVDNISKANTSDILQSPATEPLRQVISPAVSFSPQLTHNPSSYEEETASYQHDWERRIGDNTYAPPKLATPWGEEAVVGGNENSILLSEDRNQSPGWKKRFSARPDRRQSGPPWDHTFQSNSAHTTWETSQTEPGRTIGMQSFSGSWDDQNTVEKDPSDPPALPIDKHAPAPARQVRSDIGLNKIGRRIDLPLPALSPGDWERFVKRTQRNGLCNEHHLRGDCRNTTCRFDHNDIDAGVLLALRYKARESACFFGPACRRHECYGAHLCPFMRTRKGCKHNCVFEKKGLHDDSDLKIVTTIPA